VKGGGPLPLRVGLTQGAGGRDLLGLLAAEIELLTWPEREPVDFDVSYHEGRGDFESSLFLQSYVEVHPRRPLEDRWYVLSVRRLPDFVNEPYPPTHLEGVGVAASRFHPRSHPVLRRVTACTAQDCTLQGNQAICPGVRLTGFAEFSEGVGQFGELGDALTFELAGTRCSEGAYKIPVSWLPSLYDCGLLADQQRPQPLRVHFVPGLETPSGQPVTLADGGDRLTLEADGTHLGNCATLYDLGRVTTR
jgi:hypothetical protein